jgi:hypothetical protein
VTRPARRGDELDRGFLERAGNEKILGEAGVVQALEGGAAGADGADA